MLLLAACASFEREADQLRRALHIPGMSAAIVQNQKVVWTRGFGYADLENRVPATPDTLYHVASVTKTFGSTLAELDVELRELVFHVECSTCCFTVRITAVPRRERWQECGGRSRRFRIRIAERWLPPPHSWSL